jgi:hypothetical protein
MALSRFCNPSSLLRTIVLVVVVAQPFAARAADPFLMYLLGFAGNLLESSMKEDEANRSKTGVRKVPSIPAPETLPALKAPASMDQEDLRELIDESFSYLSRAQLTELHTELEKALDDPANSAHREAMLNEFVEVARKVQYTHSQLKGLPPDDKRLLAERFAANSRNLSPDQQQALRERLMQRTLPMPTDLNDMVLAALTPTRQ